MRYFKILALLCLGAAVSRPLSAQEATAIVHTSLADGAHAGDRFHSFWVSPAGVCAVGETREEAAGGFSQALVVWKPTSGAAVRAVFGGDGDSAALAISGSCERGAVIAGRTAATNFPAAANQFHGGTDGFLLSLDANLAAVNSVYVGGAGDDSLVSLTAHYAAGSTRSATLGDADAAPSFGGADALIGRYELDRSGRVSFSLARRWGGAGDDTAVALAEYQRVDAADPSGSLVSELLLAGSTTSLNLTGTTRSSFGGGASDGFYARFRVAGGDLISADAEYVGGAGNDTVSGISVENGSGYVRMLLNTDSAELPGAARALARTSNASGEGLGAAVVRLDGDGFALYHLRIGGSGDVRGLAIAEASVMHQGAGGSSVVMFDDSALDPGEVPVIASRQLSSGLDETIPAALAFDASDRVVALDAAAAPSEKSVEPASVRTASTAAPARLASATFLNSDSVTQGAWKTLYGGDGYFIPNLATNYPTYATVTRTGTAYTWDPNPAGGEAPRALDRPTPPGRFASAVIDGSQFQFDINFTDGLSHRVALYMHDWQSSTATESVTILDQATSAVLDVQNVASYRAGRWLVYTLSGRVLIRITRTGGSWAQLAGIFFGGSASGSLSATGGATQSTTVNTAFANAIEVTLRDGSNAPVVGATVTFSVPNSGASAGLSATTATTNASGVASVTATANSVAGAYLVTALANGSSTSFSLTNLAGAPASIAATGGASQTATVSTAFGSALQATVRDANNNAVSGVLVSFAPPGAGASATLSAPSATTNASGVASVNATANATVGGPYSVVATAGGVPGSATFSLTNAPNTPASVAANGGTPQNATVSTAFATALQVVVRNAGNAPVSGVLVTFAVPASGASAVLSSATATTDASGLATVTATANATAGGPYTVSATVAGVAAPANFSLTNLAIGGANSAVFLGNDSVTQGAWKQLYGGDGYYIPNLATLYPSYASVGITGTPYTWVGTVSPSDPSNGPRAVEKPNSTDRIGSTVLDGSAVQVDLNLTDGLPHRVAFYVADWQAANALSVTVRDFATSAVLDTQAVPAYRIGQWLVYTLRGHVVVKLTRTAGSWAQLAGIFFGGSSTGTAAATGGSGQSATINTAFATALQVTVRDGNNAPVVGAVVSFAAPASGASAGLSATSATTNGAGVASVTATANATAGSYQVTASAIGSTVNFALMNTAGPAASIMTSGGTPQTAPVNTAFATTLQATVRDAGSNTVSGVTVTFVPPASGAGAALSSPTAVTNASGVASVTATANSISGLYNVSASASGTGSASFALTNTAGPAASVSATGGATQTTSVNTAFPVSLQVTVRDAGNNPVSGSTVTFAAPASGSSATFSAPSAITNASGVASVSATANGTGGGPYNVTASVSGVAAPANFSLTNTVNPPASVAVSSGTPQTTAINTAFASALQVVVRDAGNLPVSGVTVNFVANGVGANAGLSSSTAVTNGAGLASVTASANGTVGGPYTVSASVAGVGGSADFSLTNAATAPASLAANAGSGQSAVVTVAFGTALQVLVRDAGNSPLSGVVVNFSAPGAGASAGLSASSATTNGSGLASVTATANTVAGGYNVVASAGALTANFALTNTAGVAASIAATSGFGQSATVSTPFGAALVATVRDAHSNPVSGATVTFTPPASGASAVPSSLTAVTNVSGQASVMATANSTAGGPYNVAATTTGVGAAANFALTNTALAGGGTSATFVAVDSLTEGNWRSQYGADGYFIPTLPPSYPSYATGTATGTPYVWADNVPAGPNFARAIEKPGTTARIGSTMLDASFIQVDLNLTDGQAHRVAFYMADWQSGNAATFTVRDFATSTLLDTQTIPAYRVGQWLVYTLRGHVIVKLTRTAGSWAQLAGIFFGGPAAGSVNAITGTPQGTPVGTPFSTPLQVRVLTGSNAPVSGATVTFTVPASGASATLSAGSASTDAGGYASVTATANNTGGSYNVVASANGSSVNFALTNTSGPPASISVTSGSPQTATINTAFGLPLKVTVRDVGSNPIGGVLVTFTVPGSGASAALSSLTATTDGAGVASVTATANGSNGAYAVTASIAGVVTPATFSLNNIVGSLTPAVADFQGFNLTIQGWWQLLGKGTDGYSFPTATTTSPFQYGALIVPANSIIWNADASNAPAMQKPNSNGRIAAAFSSPTTATAGVPAVLTYDLNVSAGRTEQVSLYWMNGDGATHTQTVEILDAQSQALLYTRAIPNFDNGRWMVWNISGHVIIRITETTPGQAAVSSGIFFNPIP